ncbi:hypothetical protein pipiens_000435, partial [Culex pipiens pipiens]
SCVSPEGLQDSINEIVAKYPRGRSFVRPSGTEYVVRVYDESETKNGTLQLALEHGIDLIFPSVNAESYELATKLAYNYI